MATTAESETAMSAEAAILTRSWRVGSRTASLSVPRPKPGKPLHVCIEWDPSPPSQLSTSEWREYREGRNAALADLAAELGIGVGVVDL
jgi:hypothetical protein